MNNRTAERCGIAPLAVRAVVHPLLFRERLPCILERCTDAFLNLIRVDTHGEREKEGVIVSSPPFLPPAERAGILADETMKLAYSSRFLGSFEKLPRSIQEIFRIQEALFTSNPFDPRLRTHKLKGREEWSFLVTYDIRVIFVFRKDTALLVNIGDHSVYRRT